MILRESLRMAATGMAIGLACAYSATRLIANLLYGVEPGDAATFAGAAVVLASAAALAGCLPALRASRIDPMAALRHE